MPISQTELNEWKQLEVTRFYKNSIDQRVQDVLTEVPTWNAETLLKRQGYLEALADMNPRNFTIEGIE